MYSQANGMKYGGRSWLFLMFEANHLPCKSLRQCKSELFNQGEGVENFKETSVFTVSFVHFMHPLLNAHPVSLFVEVKRSQGT